jgi:hypothetical protein
MTPAPPARTTLMEEGQGAPMIKGFAPSWLSAILVAVAAAFALPAHAAGPLRAEAGRLQELIARLASSDYVLGKPSRDDRPYVDPTEVLTAFRHVAAALAWGDVKDAARKASLFDYEVVKFTDNRTHSRYLVLRQNLDREPQLRGWGSYIINPDSRIDALVEVPHPLADEQTPEIGGAVFERSAAKGFLLAGAHREKADVPDLVDSMFHQVHAAWIGPAAQVVAWQIHGYVNAKHPFPNDARIVASAGDGGVVPELTSLDAISRERGLTSYVYNDRPANSRTNRRLNDGVPGVTFTSLAAAANEQGRLSRSLGGSFVHVELESSVRLDVDQRTTAVAVIATAMRGAKLEDAVDGTATLASAELPAAMELPGDEVAEQGADHSGDAPVDDRLAVRADARPKAGKQQDLP